MIRKVWQGLFSKQQMPKKAPPKRYILLFGEHEITLFLLVLEQKIPVRLYSCAWEDSPDFMMTFLEAEPYIPIDFFYGGAGQFLKIEPMPDKLGYWDMFQWSRNKWKFFRQQSFFSSLHYQFFPEKRLIFGSFPKQERLEAWLKSLKKSKRYIEDISLFIFIQGGFYKQLHESLCKSPSPWLCVVSFEEKKLIQHTILHQGGVVLTRLLPNVGEEAHKIQEIEKEIQGTLRYISKTACTVSETIDLLILKQHEDDLNASFQFSEIKQSWTLFSEQIEQLFGFQARKSSIANLSLAFAYPRQATLKPLKWSLEGYPRSYLKKRWYAKSGPSLVGCLFLLVMYLFFDFFRLEEQLSIIQGSLQSLTYQERDLDHHLNSFLFSADLLRQALWIENTLTIPQKSLEEVLQKLPEILQDKLRLRHFDWQHEEAGGNGGKSLILEAYPIVLKDPEDLENLFDHFLTSLKKQFPTCLFEILHGPYGAQPTRLLTGGLGEENNDTDPSCIVKMTWPR
ncbi:MAG: hypothetical protein ACRCYZ_04880 [Alphaproteobacteria bacterium]